MNPDFSYTICTDTGADMPWSALKQQQVEIAHLHYKMNGAAYAYDLGRETDLSAFYFAMRNGAEVGTIPVLRRSFPRAVGAASDRGRDELWHNHITASEQNVPCAQHAPRN
jgi:fatty acid-binding protein DegV